MTRFKNLPTAVKLGALGAALTVVTITSAGTALAVANGEEAPVGAYRFSAKLTITGSPSMPPGRRWTRAASR